MSTYTDDDYLAWDPFEGGDRDVKITLRTVKIVITRKPQKCFNPEDGQPHDIPAGTRARYEHALVDGEWGNYYTCLECMFKWLKSNSVPPSTGTADKESK